MVVETNFSVQLSPKLNKKNEKKPLTPGVVPVFFILMPNLQNQCIFKNELSNKLFIMMLFLEFHANKSIKDGYFIAQ